MQANNQSVNNTSVKSYFLIRMFSSACKYYNEDAKEWKSDGCEVYYKKQF